MLKRQIQQMPPFIEKALLENDVIADYNARPAYQRNDYLAWIKRAAKEETRRKRLNQMISELKKGGVYMNMKHPGSEKDK